MAGPARKLIGRKLEVLAALQANPGLLAGQIAKVSGLNPALVNQVLSELVVRKLAYSIRNEKNSNQKIWYPIIDSNQSTQLLAHSTALSQVTKLA